MCSIAALPCFMALCRVWFDNYTDRLCHSYSVTDWSISPFLEYLLHFSNTLASLHARLSASLPELATSSLAFRSYWEDKSLPRVLAWCFIVLVVNVESSHLSFLNKAVNQLPQHYWNKVLHNPKPTINWLVSHTIPGGTWGVALGDMVGLAVLGEWLDLMTLKVFSNWNCSIFHLH